MTFVEFDWKPIPKLTDTEQLYYILRADIADLSSMDTTIESRLVAALLQINDRITIQKALEHPKDGPMYWAADLLGTYGEKTPLSPAALAMSVLSKRHTSSRMMDSHRFVMSSLHSLGKLDQRVCRVIAYMLSLTHDGVIAGWFTLVDIGELELAKHRICILYLSAKAESRRRQWKRLLGKIDRDLAGRIEDVQAIEDSDSRWSTVEGFGVKGPEQSLLESVSMANAVLTEYRLHKAANALKWLIKRNRMLATCILAGATQAFDPIIRGRSLRLLRDVDAEVAEIAELVERQKCLSDEPEE